MSRAEKVSSHKSLTSHLHHKGCQTHHYRNKCIEEIYVLKLGQHLYVYAMCNCAADTVLHSRLPQAVIVELVVPAVQP